MTYRCGHPRTAENTWGRAEARCRQCTQASQRRTVAQTPPSLIALQNRQRYLPRQIEAARHKVVMLENEARRYGMTELLR